MNFATYALGMVLSGIVLMFSLPLFVNLLVAIGPLWMLVLVVGVLVYFAR